jgi:hypothetical protein
VFFHLSHLLIIADAKRELLPQRSEALFLGYTSCCSNQTFGE